MSFRAYVPDLSTPRFEILATSTAESHVHDFKTNKQPPWLYALYQHWLELWKEPLVGLTNDGVVRDKLYKIQDEGFDIQPVLKAVDDLLQTLTKEESDLVSYHIDDPRWRTWSNPEFLLSDKGLRLERLTIEKREKVHDILKASLSEEGYEKALGAMRINHFLGEICKGQAVMNVDSYNFALFGLPNSVKPWGYTFYGHHLCLNFLFYKSQIVIAPWFTGAEPNEIDEGPWKGTKILCEEERLGDLLINSLTPELREKAIIYKELKDPQMPVGRWNHDDQRHVCGAYQDNRIVPYEGVVYTSLSKVSQEYIKSILSQYLLYLPLSARQHHLSRALSFPSETYFCWIGGTSSSDAFYYRIQTPTIVVEFDHHSGVFLNNQDPKRFHIHTTLRYPNAGDYGLAIRRQVGAEQKIFKAWEPDAKL